jgi:O-antigen/teichoic acid export membrane protein
MTTTATPPTLPRPGASAEERDESRLERMDRNTIELMGELRVAATGIQVLLAFLLVVPFNARFTKLSGFERYDYFVTLLCIAGAAALLIAPAIHHRLLFRRNEKEYIVRVANRTTIAAIGLLSVGLTGILVLISDFMFGGATAIAVGAPAALGVGGLWFGVPLVRRRRPNC